MKDQHPTASASLLASGHVLGGVYRIERVLAPTSSGAVYEAVQTRLNRLVAVKTLNESLAHDTGARSQLTREAERVSQLHHPHIVEVLDFDHAEQGIPYLVMELLQGSSLAQRLERRGAIEVSEALRIAVQVASALTSVHATGLAHGSLRPSAVFLVDTAEAPFAKLLNFGISRPTPTSQSGARILNLSRLRGTHDAYLAPGLSRSVDDTKLDDQYLLAVLLYEMLAGHPPEPKRSLGLFKKSGASVPPPSQRRSGIPAAVDRVLLRALDPNRGARYPEMKDFSAELLEAGRGLLKSQRPAIRNTDFTSIRRGGVSTTPVPGVRSETTVSSVPHPRAATPPQVQASERSTPAHVRQSTPGRVTPSRAPRRPSSDPVETLLGQVRHGVPTEAVTAALSLVRQLSDTKSAQVERRVADHQERIIEVLVDYLGGENSVGRLVRYPKAGEPVSPESVFLLSRLEGGTPWGQVVLLSPLPRLESWALLAELKRAGLVTADER